MEEIRIQKLLAVNGVASRRKIEEYIKEKRITVNGKVASLGDKISPKDKVCLDGKNIKLKDIDDVKKETYILNKPLGYVSTAKDQFNRPIVTELIKTNAKIVPAGRLDAYTTGLLILSNDGELINKITHPKEEVEKRYVVGVKGKITDNILNKLRNGVIIDNKKTYPAKVNILDNMKNTNEEIIKLEIIIHEGRNRQVRKMCEAVGLKVMSLHRTNIGHISLLGLKIGEYRKMTQEELEKFN